MLCSHRLIRNKGTVDQRQTHLGRCKDLLDPLHERSDEFTCKFGSILGSGYQIKLDSKLFIDERAYCYSVAFGPQCAGHRQKCDANVFRDQLKSFFGRQHILIVPIHDALLYCAKLKSECSRDELPLDPDVATILLEWKRFCPATEGGWVFPSPRTAKPYDSGSLRKKVLQAAALRAKIQGRIGWHTFRHSYRAWLDETGTPLGVQQKLMRHANISTTMNVYGGACMESKRKANTSVEQRVLVHDHTK